MRDDPEAVPGVPVGELPVAWTLLVLGCVAGALLAGEFNRLTLRIAAPFLLVGGLLALASVRAVGRGATLATRGPYRWLRHPYFLGVLLMIAGAIIAMRSLPALELFIPTLRVTLMRARREEHNLALRFGDAYGEYRARVPFILPVRPPLTPEGAAAIAALEAPPLEEEQAPDLPAEPPAEPQA